MLVMGKKKTTEDLTELIVVITDKDSGSSDSSNKFHYQPEIQLILDNCFMCRIWHKFHGGNLELSASGHTLLIR